MAARMKPLKTAKSTATATIAMMKTRASPQVRGGKGPYDSPIMADTMLNKLQSHCTGTMESTIPIWTGNVTAAAASQKHHAQSSVLR